jgi:two-component system, chemotaxis family, CheB/CheR fusion protein
MNTPLIVAVASDAGDLEAVGELLSALPAECDATLIVVQQVDASREKSLLHTLAKRSGLAVLRAQDGVLPEARHVYVSGAHELLTLSSGRIRVAAGKTGGARNPADFLFASLAQERGAEAIGVVLSGAGADGALGIRAIKAHGGVTLAQYPGSARFPSMPISAIETGCVGRVLRPYEIAIELSRLCQGTSSVAGVTPRALSVDTSAVIAPRPITGVAIFDNP